MGFYLHVPFLVWSPQYSPSFLSRRNSSCRSKPRRPKGGEIKPDEGDYIQSSVMQTQRPVSVASVHACVGMMWSVCLHVRRSVSSVCLSEREGKSEARTDRMFGYLGNSCRACSMLQGRQPPIPGLCGSGGPVQT